MTERKKFRRNPSLWLRCSIIVILVLLIAMLIVSLTLVFLCSREIIPPEKSYRFTPIPGMLVIFISVLIGAVITLFLGRRVIKPIDELNRSMRRVAKGDFSVQLNDGACGRIMAEMYRNFNAMVRELNGIETLRTDFIVNVSHEFKTPLAAIGGYATLLQNENLSREKMNEYLEKVIANTQRLSDMTGNVLQLSKLERQTTVTDRKRFSVDEQIRQAILLLEKEWTAKNIAFDIDLAETTYYGNENLMHIVWYNLISNAIKFSSDGGAINVFMSREGDTITVTVRDFGIGISKEAQNHIFEKFYQADKTRSGEGNGLGLALVRRIVKLAGGNISVSSEEGKGSTFTVTLTDHPEEHF